MHKRDSNKILTFLKGFGPVFVLTLLFVLIFFPITNKISYNSFNIKNIKLPFIIMFINSTIYGLTQFDRNRKYAMVIMYEEIPSKNLINGIQEIMQKEHWVINKNDSQQIIFKSSLYVSIWPEYLIVTINEKGLELVGCKHYLENLDKKLKYRKLHKL